MQINQHNTQHQQTERCRKSLQQNPASIYDLKKKKASKNGHRKNLSQHSKGRI